MFAPYSANHATSSPHLPRQIPVECLGIVGFHRTPFVRAHLADVQSPTLLGRIDDLPGRVSDGNDLAAALGLSIDLLRRKDRHHLKRLWLLTDGNTESPAEELLSLADQASAAFININAIPVGMPYDGKLLESIVRRTHNGKYVSPQSFLRETDEVVAQDYRCRWEPGHHRCEAAILCVDLSAQSLRRAESSWAFAGGRVIDQTVEICRRLIDLKRRVHGVEQTAG